MTAGSAVRRCFARVGAVLRRAERWATERKHALYGFAVLRIISGATMLGFLTVNFSTRFYSYGAGSAWSGEGLLPVSAFSTMPVFGLVHRFAYDDLVFTILYIVLAMLAVLLVMGYRFRVVLPIAFVLWVGLLEQTSILGDMSDNLARIILFFLFFTDAAAVWSLDAARRQRLERRGLRNPVLRWVQGLPVLPAWLPNLLHNAALVLLVYQICLVYFTGGFYKIAGESWRDGTAVWYPLQVDVFSTFPEVSSWLLSWGPVVALATVGTVLVQIWFPLMLLRRWTRMTALAVILVFHVSIAVFMGLFWFSLWMVALDAILISDASYRRIADAVRSRRARRRGRPDDPEPRDAVEPPEDVLEDARSTRVGPSSEREVVPMT